MADILIVEDDDELRSVISRRLSLEGHHIAEAADGVAASQQLRVRAFELMITDIVMPDMDGLQLILETKKNLPKLKILAVTGGGATDPNLRLVLAQKFGADDLLLKPFSLSDLVQRLTALLQA